MIFVFHTNMISAHLKDTRKQMFAEIERTLLKDYKSEDDIFYHHSSEDRVVLSHALFWVMTSCVKGSVAKQKFVLLLRKYQEELLDAYLTESVEFQNLLHYCNIIYNALPVLLKGLLDILDDKDVRRLSAIATVAVGYGGDMSEALCNELLDDMDFYYNKVKCRKIESVLPKLREMVMEEQKFQSLSL